MRFFARNRVLDSLEFSERPGASLNDRRRALQHHLTNRAPARLSHAVRKEAEHGREFVHSAKTAAAPVTRSASGQSDTQAALSHL